MKQKSQEEKYKHCRKINALLVKLESCRNALEEHKNLNLAEVIINEYMQDIPKKMADEKLQKSIKKALEKRNKELLLAATEAEIERLEIEKIKTLRNKIIRF